MREFECPEGIMVHRLTVDAFVAAFGTYKSRGEKVVCRHLGIQDVTQLTGEYIPLRAFMSAMAELQQQFGQAVMRRLGTIVSGMALVPPEVRSVETAMALLDVTYRMNHGAEAAGKIGGYYWQPTGARSGTMHSDTPNPCSFDAGILTGFVQRFEPQGSIGHGAGPCRHEGGTSCVYQVEW